MARKSTQKARATRAAILEAAGRVLLARGIARTSLSEIAEEAGVTRGAIYWHFTRKDVLLRTLWESLLREQTVFFQAADGREESDPLGFLVEQLFGFLKHLPENTRRQRLVRLFLQEYPDSGQAASLRFVRRDFQQQRVQAVAALLAAAIEKRQLPPGIDALLGAIALIAYVDGLAPQYQQLVDEMGLHLETTFLINALLQLLRFGCIRPTVVTTPAPAACLPEEGADGARRR